MHFADEFNYKSLAKSLEHAISRVAAIKMEMEIIRKRGEWYGWE
jgi:hypothetical protein